MIFNETKKPFRSAALLPLLASSLALGGCIAGPTYGTGKGSNEQLLEDVTGILQLGPKDNREAIEYKPRPELVRPAKGAAELPAPQDTVASADPSWPESPEARRKRIRAEATLNRDNAGYVPEVAPPRIEDKQTAATRIGRGMPGDNGGVGSGMLNASQQREDFNRRLAASQQGSPNARRYLSEPPLVYRQPSVAAPTGDVGEDEAKKEARLKREARKRAGRSSTSWADIWPF